MENRAPRTKSRNGCLTCKLKRRKCDETKPQCLNCCKHKIECGGYATKYKWRLFNECGPSETLASPLSHPSLRHHMELASLSVTGKSIGRIKEENDLIAQGRNPKSRRKRLSLSLEPLSSLKSAVCTKKRSYSANSPLSDLDDVRLAYNKLKRSALDRLADAAIEDDQKEIAEPFSPGFKFDSSSPSSINWLDTIDKHSPGTLDDYNLSPLVSALIQYAIADPNEGSSEKLAGLPLSPLAFSSLSDEGLFRSHSNTPRGESPSEVAVAVSPSLSIQSNPAAQKLMRSAEQEQILYLYSRYTCSIMSIKDGPHENPWRTMIIPYAMHYPCLFNSLACMTLFHLAGSKSVEGVVQDSDGLRSRGYMYMKRCILELASGLLMMNKGSETSLPADIALTTCLNLAVSESWNTHTSSGIAHLKGAKSMIQRVLEYFKEHMTSEDKLAVRKKLVMVEDDEWESMESRSLVSPGTSAEEDGNTRIMVPRNVQFLFNIWIYFEVLAQMTTYSTQDDKGIDLVATITTILQSNQNERKDQGGRIKRESDAGHEEAFIQSPKSEASDGVSSSNNGSTSGGSFFGSFDDINFNNEYVDPLLGCAQSLFLVMGKVANLISKIKRHKPDSKKTNSLSIITAASSLKQQLIDWNPDISSSMNDQIMKDPLSSTWDISSCIATAEAYRYATLLLLHQAVPEIHSMTSRQLAEKIFVLMASIPLSSNLFIVHIFPLLVSSCEAEEGDERDWCSARWILLSKKIWIGNIDRALEVVKEVWKRKDDYRKRQRENGEDPLDKDGSQESQIGSLLASIKSDHSIGMDDVRGGIGGRLHWSTVMREWGWEVLLG